MNSVVNSVSEPYLPHGSGVDKVKIFWPFHETLDMIRDVVKNKQVVIAGGAIRDMMMLGDENKIKDIDVFLLDTDEKEANSLLPAFASKMRGRTSDNGYTKTPVFQLLWITEFPFVFSAKWKDHPIPVQVIAHTAKTVEELIQGFD
ncbi:MAG: hypothetical protein MN733_33915, partial [Nitrososphaera sp.]|nr:hypothetical protein [Nitrososphaera sp.]